ncbi:MAG TPA: DUF72 domain-containing protein [Methylovirgula sp.]|jgi:uncharacterized protein YecE (DUF72 family)|nr:DUF72 domain-containing protein [Methylovirgula sp.]
MPRAIHIGTSGWHYDHWRGPFYPDDMKPADMLRFYAEHFATVEINNSFYRLPNVTTVKSWGKQVPKDFIFAPKASRYTTHTKRLKDAPKSFEKYFPRVDPLKKKLGPVLFQLPPRFVPDVARLETFIAALPKRHRYAFEFRDPRWFTDDVCDVLSAANCAFCIFDIGGLQSPNWLTADFAYIRLHGPGKKYQGSYSDNALRQWAKLVRSFARKDADVFCYFDNDQKGYAPKDALRLKKMLARRSR